MNAAAVEGLSRAASPPTHEDELIRYIRHSNEVFSAFKAQAWGQLMQSALLDDDGRLLPYHEWRDLVEPISTHHVGAWLRTEYDTAIIRAHQAADWVSFERNKDVLPNLQWMPTTSPTPEAGHRLFWQKPLILPVDDPFWSEHRPGDRWNCKCSLDSTDAPVNPLDPEELSEARLPKHAAQAGLEGNPARKGLITDQHPYYPKSCASCPHYKAVSLKAWLKKKVVGRVKDCHSCEYVSEAIRDAKEGINPKYIVTESEEFGERFKISETADPIDLEDNKRVSRAILRSFPDAEVSIRPHSREYKVKNPELLINGEVADNKRIQSEAGVTSAFKKANAQGCSIVVLDLDAELKRLRVNDLTKYIERRHRDFVEGNIKQCFIILDGKSVSIDRTVFKVEEVGERKERIKLALSSLKEK